MTSPKRIRLSLPPSPPTVVNYNPYRPTTHAQLPQDIKNKILSFHPMINHFYVTCDIYEDFLLWFGKGGIICVQFISENKYLIFQPNELNTVKNLFLNQVQIEGYSNIKDFQLNRLYLGDALSWFPNIDPQLGFKFVPRWKIEIQPFFRLEFSLWEESTPQDTYLKCWAALEHKELILARLLTRYIGQKVRLFAFLKNYSFIKHIETRIRMLDLRVADWTIEGYYHLPFQLTL